LPSVRVFDPRKAVPAPESEPMPVPAAASPEISTVPPALLMIVAPEAVVLAKKKVAPVLLLVITALPAVAVSLPPGSPNTVTPPALLVMVALAALD
jgi:hypothetical protein